ncbi:hypothetical protein C8Q80DRAFT_1165901 [Daedaleopsis nitida]|nr:hypothetical protein C8Q80DRAFT_1165901 [Daedaleopsis nitida]
MQKFQDCNQKVLDVEEDLHTLKNTHKGETAGRVVATVVAQRDTEAMFQLTYVVTGAQWQPHYDLHASAASGKPSEDVTLLYYANITQSTGEDWTDTSFTLSTATSQTLQSLSVPALDPLKISPILPVHARQDAAISGFSALFGAANPAQFSAPPNTEEDFDMVQIAETAPVNHTVVARNPLALAYRVDGLATVPSDGIAHKVTLARLEFSAKLQYVCVPRKTAAAFIEATIKNTSEYELLAGPVSVFMDDGFVTKTSLSLIGANESFTCVLGIDTALKVDHSRSSTTSREPELRSFAEPNKTTTRTTVTTVRNGHLSDISGLVVRDALPLGNEFASVKVVLRKPDGLAAVKEGGEAAVDLGEGVQDAKVRWTKVEHGRGGEKDGMFEWVCGTVAAGKEVAFEAEWAIKMPAKTHWAEMK